MLGIVYVLPQQKGAQINTTKLKLNGIETSLNMYKTNVGTYPNEDEGGLSALMRKPNYDNEKLGERWMGPYVKRGTTLDDAWGHALQYEIIDKTLTEDTSGPDYRLFSVGPDGQPETEDDISLYDVDPLDPEGSVVSEEAGAITPPSTQ